MSEDVTLPAGTKPSKALAKGKEAAFRPALGQACVRDGNLYATDSYTMVRLPVELDDCVIPKPILEAGEKSAAEGIELRGKAVRVRLKDGTVVEGTPVDVPKTPDYEQLIPALSKPVKVALNPDLLRNVALGLGANGAVALTLDAKQLAANKYTRPIKVEPLDAEDDRLGLVMPVRIRA